MTIVGTTVVSLAVERLTRPPQPKVLLTNPGTCQTSAGSHRDRIAYCLVGEVSMEEAVPLMRGAPLLTPIQVEVELTDGFAPAEAGLGER